MKHKNQSFKKKSLSVRKCSCGKILKERSRKNYPFGLKSKPRTRKYFRCVNCGEKRIKLGEENGTEKI